MNWWLDTDPKEVFAYGDLEFYGKNHSLRSTHCRVCEFKHKCQFFYDITKDEHFMKLYVANEKYDGYLRDSCVWKEDINIYDKMAVQVKYANNVQMSYSLTAYSPYEGYRIAFNGTKGRLETWIHSRQPWPKENYDQLRITDNFGKTKLINSSKGRGSHAGGDIRLRAQLLGTEKLPDPLKQAAGTRDGAMSILVGVAARKSIEEKRPVKIAELVDIEPQPKRPV